MSQTIPLTTVPATPANGIQLPCPRCTETNANITLRLADPQADNAFCCEECGESFGRADIEAIVRRWVPFFRWLDAMPAAVEE
jgi:transposase-like protein